MTIDKDGLVYADAPLALGANDDEGGVVAVAPSEMSGVFGVAPIDMMTDDVMFVEITPVKRIVAVVRDGKTVWKLGENANPS